MGRGLPVGHGAGRAVVDLGQAWPDRIAGRAMGRGRELAGRAWGRAARPFRESDLGRTRGHGGKGLAGYRLPRAGLGVAGRGRG